MKINYCLKKPDAFRTFRNVDCQAKFFELTNESSKLRNCFLKAGNIEKQASSWFKALNGTCYQSFRKIRHNSKKKENPVSLLMERRRSLIKKLKEAEEDEKDEIEAEITEEEVQVSDMVGETNINKVIENFKSLSQQDGKMNTNNMWKLKLKVFPKNKGAFHK